MEQKKAARRPKNRKRLIGTLLRKIEKEFKTKGKETKATVADFIRLTQLERELEEQDQPREIIITWAEPAEKFAGWTALQLAGVPLTCVTAVAIEPVRVAISTTSR